MFSQIGQNSGLLALLLEPFECALEAFVVVNDHFGHAGEVTPLAPWLGGFVKPNNLERLDRRRKGEWGTGELSWHTPHSPFSLSLFPPFSLSRGPPHRTAAQHVQVQMIHALAAISPGIGHDPIAARIEPQLACNLRSKRE